MKIELDLRKDNYRSWLLIQKDDKVTSEHSFSSLTKYVLYIRRCLTFYKFGNHFKVTIETAPKEEIKNGDSISRATC